MFGISSYCLHQLPLETALEKITALTETVEIMDDGPHYLSSPAILENYDVRFYLHAPCRSVNIASSLEPIRRASVEVLDQCFCVAAEVNAPVIIHPGYFTWRGEKKRALSQLRQSLDELLRAAKELSVTFFIENMGNWDYFFVRYPSELGIIDRCGLALDVGHAYLNGCLDDFLAVPIAHFHLHDNDGKEDTHAQIGAGTIDFKKIMAVVKKSGIVPVIEVETFTGVEVSIAILEKL